MYRKLSVLLSISVIILAFLMVPFEGQAEPEETVNGAVYHTQKGLSHFQEAFYELMPIGKREEALQRYRQAVTEFKKGIAINEGYVEAHRHLARVYYVQNNFSEAAEQYKRVTELAPSDMDAYLNLASSYERMNRYSDAIEQLEKAKTLSSQAMVIDRINGLIVKLQKQN
jgi:tetratricopeptide (TPR) repeat protein